MTDNLNGELRDCIMHQICQRSMPLTEKRPGVATCHLGGGGRPERAAQASQAKKGLDVQLRELVQPCAAPICLAMHGGTEHESMRATKVPRLLALWMVLSPRFRSPGLQVQTHAKC
jgi:hypothetical protein